MDCVGADDAAGDSMDYLGLDGACIESASQEWNGRDIDFITVRNAHLALLAQLYAAALKKSAILEQTKASHEHHYHLLNMQETLPGKVPTRFEDCAQLPLAPLSHRAFSLIDPTQFQVKIEDCRNIFGKAIHGVKKCTKAVGHGITHTAKKVGHFVKEHKKQILIGAGIAAVAVGAYMCAGALINAAAGAAAAGAAAAQGPSTKRREEENSPSPNAEPTASPPSDPPSGIPPIERSLRPQNPITRFLERLQNSGLPLPAGIPPNLYPQNNPPPHSTPEPVFVPPPEHSLPPPELAGKNPLAGLFEQLQGGRVNSPTDTPFDLHHKNNPPPQNISEPVFIPPVEFAPKDPLAGLFEQLQSDRVSSHAGIPLDLHHKNNPPQHSAPKPMFVPPVEPTATNPLARLFEQLQDGKANPRVNTVFDLHHKGNPPQHSAPEPLPAPPLEPAAKNPLAGLFEKLQGGKVTPHANAPFDLHHKNNPPPDDVPGLPLENIPKSFLANFFEYIGQGITSVGAHLPSAGILPTHRASLSPPEPSQLSCYVEVPGFERVDKRIGVANGMNTSLEECYQHLEYTKKLASGMRIEGVYNHSNGPWGIGDLLEIAFLNYPGVAPITADVLIENWARFHEENKNNPNAKYLQIAHSMGTILTRNALRKAPKEIRDRVIVVCIGTAIVIPDELCHQSFAFASKRDFVHLGEDVYTYFIRIFSDEPQQRELLQQLLVSKGKLIVLDPHLDAKLMDHDYESPTFTKEIKDIIEAYLKQ
jgi:hypothetical protein